MKPIPPLSADLIKDLNEQYKLTNPDVGQSLELIMFKAGQRSVVENLNSRLKSFDDNILNS